MAGGFIDQEDQDVTAVNEHPPELLCTRSHLKGSGEKHFTFQRKEMGVKLSILPNLRYTEDVFPSSFSFTSVYKTLSYN